MTNANYCIYITVCMINDERLIQLTQQLQYALFYGHRHASDVLWWNNGILR
jgi:hypothetical protein